MFKKIIITIIFILVIIIVITFSNKNKKVIVINSKNEINEIKQIKFVLNKNNIKFQEIKNLSDKNKEKILNENDIIFLDPNYNTLTNKQDIKLNNNSKILSLDETNSFNINSLNYFKKEDFLKISLFANLKEYKNILFIDNSMFFKNNMTNKTDNYFLKNNINFNFINYFQNLNKAEANKIIENLENKQTIISNSDEFNELLLKKDNLNKEIKLITTTGKDYKYKDKNNIIKASIIFNLEKAINNIFKKKITQNKSKIIYYEIDKEINNKIINFENKLDSY